MTAADGAPGDAFGIAVSLSADGNTALVGAYFRNNQAGAAYVFARSGTTWGQQQELTAADGAPGDAFGVAVALSADGNTALVGAECDNCTGAAYVFARTGATWTQQAELTAADDNTSDLFGRLAALSTDGDTALIGADGDNNFTGAAYLFVQPVATQLTNLGPESVSSAGPLAFTSLTATLADGSGTPQAGQTLSFELAGSGHAARCMAVTNALGTATCGVQVPPGSGPDTLIVQFRAGGRLPGATGGEHGDRGVAKTPASQGKGG